MKTYLDKKSNAIRFLEWCNTPIFKPDRQLGFHKRAVPQFPDYKSYDVIDEKGRSVLPEGKFLSSEELYDYWCKEVGIEEDWISVDKDLPNDGDVVLCLNHENGNQFVSQFISKESGFQEEWYERCACTIEGNKYNCKAEGCKGIFGYHPFITDWMPLPETHKYIASKIENNDEQSNEI